MNMNNKPTRDSKYGWDTLSIVIGVIGFILWAFVDYGSLVGIPLIIYAFWRSRSKDYINRKREEKVFYDVLKKCMKILSRLSDNAMFYEVRKSFNEWLKKMKGKDQYITVTCPECKTIVKLKKKKDTIMIICPKCSTRFRIKI